MPNRLYHLTYTLCEPLDSIRGGFIYVNAESVTEALSSLQKGIPKEQLHILSRVIVRVYSDEQNRFVEVEGVGKLVLAWMAYVGSLN